MDSLTPAAGHPRVGLDAERVSIIWSTHVNGAGRQFVLPNPGVAAQLVVVPGMGLLDQAGRVDRLCPCARDVAHLIPAARAARNALAASGHTLSRDRLANRMRHDGHGVSNERGSLLLKILKAEANVTQLDPAPVATHAGDRAPVAS